jgi:predicted ATPase
LIALVKQAGTAVSKSQLIACAWPNRQVEDAALRFQIGVLRKALDGGRHGKRFIVNIPGRGYVFVAPVERTQVGSGPDSASPATLGTGVPQSITDIIGRDSLIQRLSMQVTRRRISTIVGPGGIGKTRVAIAVAEAMRGSHDHGVWYIELASVPAPDLVTTALSGVFGIPLPARDPICGLVSWLRDKHALIVIDNCEHVIDAVAPIVDAILRSSPHISILATSREPLRIQGEWRHRLPPLDFPPIGTRLKARDALSYPAVQLFNERAMASSDQFSITDEDVPAVLEICQRLDGVPLALELAAARVMTFGIKGLASRLNDYLPLSGLVGPRTASPRQQTLGATLDWSFGLLSEDERAVLRRLSVFQGTFSLVAAEEVASDETLLPQSVLESVAELVNKSLIVAEFRGDGVRYRLLEMTRAYALQKLQNSGEKDRTARLHGEYFVGVFARADNGAATRTREEWQSVYGRDIGNLRAALTWAFSSDGNIALGVRLAAVATDVWIALSMHSECCDWGIKAVELLGSAKGTRDEMLLQCGLGQALTRSRGAPPAARAALQRALVLAEGLADVETQFRALFGLWLFSLRLADLKECMELSRRYDALADATGDGAERAIADWVSGDTLYYLGDHRAAAAKLKRARFEFARHMRAGYRIRLGVDIMVAILSYQAVTFWSLGLIDQALQAAREAVDEARSIDHPVSLCIALTAPRSTLLVKTGHLEDAEREINTLIEHTRAYSLAPYHSYGLCSKGCLAAAKGDLAEAKRLLHSGLQRSRETGNSLFDSFFQAEFAAVLGADGQVDDGQLEIDAALARAKQSGSLWCMPELLRIKGDLLLRQGKADDAEVYLERSLAVAHGQGALFWELRSALSFARLHAHNKASCELVASVYHQFTEGFGTTDLVAARRLIQQQMLR